MPKSGQGSGPTIMPNDIPGTVPGLPPSPVAPVPTVNPYPGPPHPKDVPPGYSGPVQPLYRSDSPDYGERALNNDEEGDAEQKDE